MAERGFEVEHSTFDRWIIKRVPLLENAFRKPERPVDAIWWMDETSIKLRGQCKGAVGINRSAMIYGTT